MTVARAWDSQNGSKVGEMAHTDGEKDSSVGACQKNQLQALKNCLEDKVPNPAFSQLVVLAGEGPPESSGVCSSSNKDWASLSYSLQAGAWSKSRSLCRVMVGRADNMIQSSGEGKGSFPCHLAVFEAIPCTVSGRGKIQGYLQVLWSKDSDDQFLWIFYVLWTSGFLPYVGLRYLLVNLQSLHWSTTDQINSFNVWLSSQLGKGVLFQGWICRAVSFSWDLLSWFPLLSWFHLPANVCHKIKVAWRNLNCSNILKTFLFNFQNKVFPIRIAYF